MDFSRLLVSPRDSEVPESLPSPQAAGKWLLNALDEVGWWWNQCYCPKHALWEDILAGVTFLGLVDLGVISSEKGWEAYTFLTPCGESEYELFEQESLLYTTEIHTSLIDTEVRWKILRRNVE